MIKKIFKNILIGVSVLCFAASIGVLSFAITQNIIANTSNEAVETTNNTSPSDGADTGATANGGKADANSQTSSYYLAKLENDGAINIYYCSAGAREYLRSIKVYAPGLPTADKAALTEGVILNTKEELLSFEEDYGS